jgi:hypothetical protein
MHKCFMVEGTENVAQFYRRYQHSSDGAACPGKPGKYSYHNARNYIGDAPVIWSAHGDCKYISNGSKTVLDKTDPRWPTKCDACDYVFTEDDEWQLFVEHIYLRPDTGELYRYRDLPVGAMWYAAWAAEFWTGPDGKSLMVKTPGGEWQIDSRANNCDSLCKNCNKPYHAHNSGTCTTYEDSNPHNCWIRHGTPPEIHVDKNGNTCGAGAGSILCGDYHGFLHNGHLT